MRQRTNDVEVKKYAIQLLEDAGSFEYTRQQMKQLDSKIRREVEKLNGNQLLKKLLDEMQNWNSYHSTNGNI